MEPTHKQAMNGETINPRDKYIDIAKLGFILTIF
jgi:hypothetical protein